MTTTPEAILRAELDSAERMIFHLKRSYSQAATLLPLSSQQVAKLTLESENYETSKRRMCGSEFEKAAELLFE